MAAGQTFVTFFGEEEAVLRMTEMLKIKLSPAPLASFMQGSLVPHFKQRAAQAFSSESDPRGEIWAPLSPTTISIRESEGYGPGPINVRTSELESYFQTADSDIDVNLLGVTLTWPSRHIPDGNDGTLKWKISTAQYGNSRSGAPARRVVGVNIQDMEFAVMGLLGYLVGVE